MREESCTILTFIGQTAPLIMLHWQHADSLSTVPDSQNATLQRNRGVRTDGKSFLPVISHVPEGIKICYIATTFANPSILTKSLTA